MNTLARAGLDAVNLAVGLGGRLDAVKIIDTDSAIITSIDIDHAELLGDTREKIGFEKAGILRTGRPAIVSDPVPPQSVIDRATEIGADLWLLGRDFNYSGDKQHWAWAGRGRRYAGLAYPALRGANQLINASGVLAALTAMRQQLPVTAQAVRNGLRGPGGRITVSLGGALAGEEERWQEWFSLADAALYQAKNAGRDTLRFYDPQMQAVVSARATASSRPRISSRWPKKPV